MFPSQDQLQRKVNDPQHIEYVFCHFLDRCVETSTCSTGKMTQRRSTRISLINSKMKTYTEPMNPMTELADIPPDDAATGDDIVN